MFDKFGILGVGNEFVGITIVLHYTRNTFTKLYKLQSNQVIVFFNLIRVKIDRRLSFPPHDEPSNVGHSA